MSVLHREDFTFGPKSLNEIEPNLYLGSLSAVRDIPTLKHIKATHILTIDTCPLPRKILELPHLTTKFIQLADQSNEDLLSHFDETAAFIDEGLSKGVVFVHCYFGISRSAAVVIAYIMKKYELSFAEAFEKVQRKRHHVCPNVGFKVQLKLYARMGHKIDKNNRHYKVFRLHLAANLVKKYKVLPHDFLDLIKSDPGLTQSQPEPNAYRCRKCRRVLATESNLLTHDNKDGQCSKMFFLEPLAWMGATQGVQDKLHCPKCETKVGSFSWIMGCQCPCGTKVAPAFYLIPAKVDFTNAVKNVEVTF